MLLPAFGDVGRLDAWAGHPLHRGQRIQYVWDLRHPHLCTGQQCPSKLALLVSRCPIGCGKGTVKR